MSRRDKLLARFRSRPSDLAFDELRTLLRGLGYVELAAGKTGGARVAFYNADTKHMIRLHLPHPARRLRRYQIDDVFGELIRRGAI